MRRIGDIEQGNPKAFRGCIAYKELGDSRGGITSGGREVSWTQERRWSYNISQRRARGQECRKRSLGLLYAADLIMSWHATRALYSYPTGARADLIVLQNFEISFIQCSCESDGITTLILTNIFTSDVSPLSRHQKEIEQLFQVMYDQVHEYISMVS